MAPRRRKQQHTPIEAVQYSDDDEDMVIVDSPTSSAKQKVMKESSGSKLVGAEPVNHANSRTIVGSVRTLYVRLICMAFFGFFLYSKMRKNVPAEVIEPSATTLAPPATTTVKTWQGDKKTKDGMMEDFREKLKGSKIKVDFCVNVRNNISN